MTPGGMEYMGSIAVHWYKTDSKLTVTTYEMDIKQQFCIDDIAEAALATGVSSLMHTIQKRFMGRRMRSTDKADKR